MSEKATEQPSESIRFSVASIINGKYFAIDTPTRYTTESDVPENLRLYIGGIRDENQPHPSDRDIYMTPAARRAARGLEMAAAQQAWAEEIASEPLREDVRAALEAEHDLHIGKLLAQSQCNQDALDRLHESLAEAAEPLEYFVRRGSVYTRVTNVRPRPGEPCFTKAGDGDWQVAGTIDSNGEPPPELITT